MVVKVVEVMVIDQHLTQTTMLMKMELLIQVVVQELQMERGTAGGSGVVILKYPSTKTITIGAGLTSTTDTERF